MIDLEAELKKKGLTYQDLKPDERKTFEEWSEQLKANQRITTETALSFVRKIRKVIEEEISTPKLDFPSNFMGLLMMLVPFYGVIKMWYMDRHTLYLQARLKNIILLEAFFTTPLRAREQIKQYLDAIPDKKSKA